MKQAITKLVVLVFLLVNQTLIIIGWNPLPFSEDEIFKGASSISTFIVAMLAWWKNNNVTKEAQQAHQLMLALKNKKSNSIGGNHDLRGKQ